MFELALRIRQGIIELRNPNADTSHTDKLITWGQISSIVIISVEFMGFVAYGIFNRVNDQSINAIFYENFNAYSFLTIAVLMDCANIFLFVQIKEKNRELGQ